MTQAAAAQTQQPATTAMVATHPSLITKFAGRFGVEPNKMMATLKATAFYSATVEITNEQMMALLVVADQYNLNPFTREIYAFPDKQKGGIVPIVSIDGWARIINDQETLDGIEFVDGPAGDKHKNAPEWIECVIYRRDRSKPTRVRERLGECYRDTGPWNSHPARMLRHKALIQCARVAFSLSGVYDEDEAQRIIEGTSSRVPDASPAIAAINAEVAGDRQPIDGESTREQHVEGDGTQAASASTDAAPAAASTEGEAPTATVNDAPTFTFAEVSAKINSATNTDELNAAVDLIKHVPDPAHQKELREAAKSRAKELAKAAK